MISGIHYPHPLLIALLSLVIACCHSVSAMGEEAAAQAPQTAAADTALLNGRFYTVNKQAPWAEAVAIADGRYVYVGDAAGINPYIGSNTQVLDVGGRMLMPGVNDVHSHPWQGGIKQLYHCNFDFSASPQEVAETLRGCLKDNPDATFIEGGQWTSDFFQTHDIPSPRDWLDEISPDVAIFLHDDATHNGWVNSQALALAGIDRDTPDPEGGVILRHEDGEPTGLLYESARRLVLDARPEWSLEQYRRAISEAVQQANSYGLTGINEARVQASMLEAYGQLEEAGELSVHVTANLQTPREYRDYPLSIEDYLLLLEKYRTQHINPAYVKIFLDGVPTASRTALMLSDYLTDEEHPEPTRGFLLVDPEVLKRDMTALDKAGFTVKLHAAGDGAVRVALDAIAAAREANGPGGGRHQLAHAGFIDADDMERFAELNATVDASPYIWFPSPIMESIEGALGPRGLRYYPLRDLIELNTDVVMGSDWPSAAVSLSPWGAIEALVTRRNPTTQSEQALWPEQAITLDQALYIATLGGARGLDIEQDSGSIEVGKLADFIVLDRNIFEVPIDEVGDTTVLETWFAGKRVFVRQ